MENQEVMSAEDIAEQEALAIEIAGKSGENTRSFNTIPTLTVYNPSKTNMDSDFEIGDIVKNIRTQQGYETEKYLKPITGIIVKTRMFLKLKYKYAEGKPQVITNEFESYDDSNMIYVKEKGLDKESKYEEVFAGNYKQVHDKYSLKSDTEVERKLDLHHAIYVLTNLETQEIVRIDSKGLSRSNYFDYMNSFSRLGLDRMSTTWSEIDTDLSTEDFNGKPRQAPIAAFKFTKRNQLSLEELRALKEIQMQFEADLIERDKMFGNVKEEKGAEYPAEQISPKEELPTIQIEEESNQLPLSKEEEDIDLASVPF